MLVATRLTRVEQTSRHCVVCGDLAWSLVMLVAMSYGRYACGNTVCLWQYRNSLVCICRTIGDVSRAHVLLVRTFGRGIFEG